MFDFVPEIVGLSPTKPLFHLKILSTQPTTSLVDAVIRPCPPPPHKPLALLKILSTQPSTSLVDVVILPPPLLGCCAKCGFMAEPASFLWSFADTIFSFVE